MFRLSSNRASSASGAPCTKYDIAVCETFVGTSIEQIDENSGNIPLCTVILIEGLLLRLFMFELKDEVSVCPGDL